MKLDLICPSFPPLPESIWIAASAMLDRVIQKCWLMLAAFVVVKILTDALTTYDQVSLATHLKTLFKALGIVVLLSYYKSILMCFDYFIDSVCIHTDGTQLGTDKLSSLAGPPDQTGVIARTGLFKLFQGLFETIFGLINILSHNGAVVFMHYMRAVALLILMQLGPLASLLSLLPGPFQRSFQTWLKSYVAISCWAITLSIFVGFIQAFRGVHLASDEAPAIAYGFLSLILLIAIFLTPTWTSRFIGSATLGNFIAGVGAAAGRIGRTALKVAVKG